MSRLVIAIVMPMALTLAACRAELHTVGGSISGLAGSGLVLANGGNARSVNAGATSFTLPNALAVGSRFNVIVQTQPIGQTCSVAGGSGTIGGTNVTSVEVTCSTDAFTLGGSLSGLISSGLVLANGEDMLTVATDSVFTFPTLVASGSPFEVTVTSQPSGLECSVSNGIGTMGAEEVTSVEVHCSARAFTLGGTIRDLASGGLVLANGSDTLSVAANANSFTMPTAVAFGSPFEVTVQAQADADTCRVSDGRGTMGAATVSSVSITCAPATFTVSTFAGSAGEFGDANGSGTTASFNFPYSIAVDNVGNLYVADTGNHQIRKITAAGEVSTLVGSVTAGEVDGIGTAAAFDSPEGVAVDGSGNVYVADTNNHKIRKITPAGEVSTFAGSDTAGSADGSGTAATFNFPNGVAVDGSGNVYVADLGNAKIRKITPAGEVSTFAGSDDPGAEDGSAATVTFNDPAGVAVDSSGNVLVADTSNHTIRRITRD